MSWESFRHGWLVVFSVMVTLFIGCGGNDGPQRYQREGKVTFNGQPVAKGEINISPDRAKGAKGPGTTVTFEDGAYRTRDGLGSLSGPHIVTISGFDGQPGNATVPELAHPWGTTLFVEHQFEIDFPAESSEHDFEVTK